MNKKSKKNNLHNSHKVSGCNHMVDRDYKFEYRIMTSLRQRARRRRREVIEEFGVNGEVDKVNGNNDDLDQRCRWCKGYDSYEF